MIAEAGTITFVNIVQTLTPLDCYYLGQSCIKDFLCQHTQCLFTNSTIYINWIW